LRIVVKKLAPLSIKLKLAEVDLPDIHAIFSMTQF